MNHLKAFVQPAHGAFPEIVERTGGGLVVEPGNPEALADGIMTLRTDTALAESMSKAGAAGVRHHYTVSRMAEHVEAVVPDQPDRSARAGGTGGADSGWTTGAPYPSTRC